MAEHISQGSLFSTDFLRESIARVADWQLLTDAEIDALAADLRAIFTQFPTAKPQNESQTEDDPIWPILVRLGWTASLRQQNLAAKGRGDVPDGLLFQDAATKVEANAFPEQWRLYGCGLAIVESKRWLRPLDRQSGRHGEETAPSTQMLRYLRRVEDLTTGRLRWGMLTNGARWRLYYKGARSVSEQFFELDLATVLAIPDHDGGLFAVAEVDRRHWLRVFALVFRRDAFLLTPSDPRTFHQRAIDEGKFYEERVVCCFHHFNEFLALSRGFCPRYFGPACRPPLNLLEFDPVPRRIADHGIKPAGQFRAFPIRPHTGERHLPMSMPIFSPVLSTIRCSSPISERGRL